LGKAGQGQAISCEVMFQESENLKWPFPFFQLDLPGNVFLSAIVLDERQFAGYSGLVQAHRSFNHVNDARQASG